MPNQIACGVGGFGPQGVGVIRGTHEVGDGVAPGAVGVGEGDVEGAVGDALGRRPADRPREHGTPAAAAAPQHRRDLLAARPRAPPRADSPNAASPRSTPRPACSRRSQLDAEADLAGDRHLRERDREPAVAHVVHARDRTRRARASATSSCRRPRRVEVGRRRHPAVETVHDRGPLRTAELGPDLAQHDDVVARREPRPRAAGRRARRSDRARRRPAWDGCRRRPTRCRS